MTTGRNQDVKPGGDEAVERDIRANNEYIETEVSRILSRLEEMEKRREGLLMKDRLTSDEKEELALLTEIARDVAELKELATDFFGDLSIGREEILKLGKLEVMLDGREKYGFSSLEILRNLSWMVDDLREELSDFSGISELEFSDKDIDEVLKQPSLVFLILKYGSVTDEQRSKLNDAAGNVEPVNDGYFFGMMLGKVKLNPKTQNKLVDVLVEFCENFSAALSDFDNMEGHKYMPDGDWDHDFWSKALFEVDILSSKYLSDVQKKRIAPALLQIASGLEAKYILRNYSQYLDAGSKALAKKVVEGDEYTKDFEIPDIYELSPTKLRGREVHFVVHPLFNFPLKRREVEAANGDIEKAMEFLIVRMMNEAIAKFEELGPNARKWDLGNAIESYLKVLEVLREYEKYIALSEDPKAVVVFVMPKSDFLSEVDTNLTKLISELGRKNSNFYYMESGTSNSGDFREWDRFFLNTVLPKRADIGLSGGYFGACLSGGAYSLVKLKSRRRVTIDYSDSTPGEFNADWIGRGISEGRLKWPSLKLSDGEVKGLEDVYMVLDRNRKFNEVYQDYLFKIFSKEKRRFGPNFYLRHKR